VSSRRGPAVLVAALVVTLLASTAAATAFERGNAAYQAGNFVTALAAYDSAVALNPSAAALHNRGNARFRLGQLGRAVADYNRAWVLAPGDRDIRANIAFLRQYRPDKSLILDNPIAALATAFLRATAASTSRILAALGCFLALALVGLYYYTGRRLFGWLAIAPGLAFLYFVAATASWAAVTNPARAAVVVPELTLRSGPGPEYKDMAIIHDGLEVVISEERPGWVLLQLPGGEGGWAETAAVERIFPR
jgi:hypothetical protein